MMRATDFEFRYRFWLIALIFCVGFWCYTFDHVNAAGALLTAIHGPGFDMDSVKARHELQGVFAAGALLAAAAATIRTWAAAYLRSEVIHDSKVRTEGLTADGPYRHVRNPLYLGTLLLTLGISTMTSRTGFLVLVAAMLLFQHRLILREEQDLSGAQGESYESYLAAVPRLWPSLRARLPASERKASWKQAWLGEAFVWGFALAVASFAATLQIIYFYVVAAASLLFYVLILRFTAPGPPERVP